MSEASNNEWVAVFYACSDSSSRFSRFERLYNLVSETLRTSGRNITHMSISSRSRRGKWQKLDLAKAQQMLGAEFADALVLSVAIRSRTPMDQANMNNELFQASYTWSTVSELSLCLKVEETIGPFLGEFFELLYHQLIQLEPWNYGFSFRDQSKRQPLLYAMGGSNGNINEQEAQSIMRWNTSSATNRRRQLRNIYPVNLLGRNCQQIRVGSQSLAEFAMNEANSSLSWVGELLDWRIPEGHVLEVRKQLQARNVLIE